MGYLLMSYQVSVSEWLFEEQWLELTSLASEYGFSMPRLRKLGRREAADLTDEEVVGLLAALERASYPRSRHGAPRCPRAPPARG